MDAEYLKANVGVVLADGLAMASMMKPDDPIDYLAQFLLKSVADDAAKTQLAIDVVEAKKVAAIKADKAAIEEKEATAKKTATTAQHSREDKRVNDLLAAATSTEEIFTAVTGYLRTRTGASVYVALTNITEKDPVPPEPVVVTEEGEAPAEPEEGYEAPPAEEEGEPPEPPPPFVPETPTVLAYVAATSNDEKLLLGKKLSRTKPPAEGEEEEAADEEGAKPFCEGVSFQAVDTFLKGDAKSLHVPRAVENRQVKFFYIPRTGAFACAPFADVVGECKGVLSADTLGLNRAFTAEEVLLLEQMALAAGEAVQRVDKANGEAHLAAQAALAEAFETTRADLAADLEAATAAEAEEDGDKLATLKAKARRSTADLGSLAGDKLAYLEMRRTMKASIFAVFKAAEAILSTEMRPKLDSPTWEGFKEEVVSALWGDELFSTIGAFDVMACSDEEGFALATAILAAAFEGVEEMAPVEDDMKATSWVAYLLLTWIRDATALFDAKVAAEKAAAEAAAEAAAAAAAAEAEAAAAAAAAEAGAEE